MAVQLRDKDLPGGPLLALARTLRQVTAAHGARLFINDRVDVALAANADGIHLGGGSLTSVDVRAITKSLSIAVSTHSPAEVQAARDAGAEFVVFGPVFATPGKSAPTGLDGLRAAVAIGVPVLALGGIDATNAAACAGAGAAGLACIRAIATASDPAQVARMFLDCFSS